MENEFIEKTLPSNNKTKQKKKKEKTNKSQSTFIQILNGDILNKDFFSKNFTFLFFIFSLLIVLVWKSHYAKQLTNDVKRTQKELDEATSDYFEAKAHLEEKTRRTELIEKLKGTGLKETVNPTKVIRIQKEK